jgi:hypothetical protein
MPDATEVTKYTFGGRVLDLSFFLSGQIILAKMQDKQGIEYLEKFFNTVRAAASICMTNRNSLSASFLDQCLANEEKIRLLDKDTINALMAVVLKGE